MSAVKPTSNAVERAVPPMLAIQAKQRITDRYLGRAA